MNFLIKKREDKSYAKTVFNSVDSLKLSRRNDAEKLENLLRPESIRKKNIDSFRI